MISIVVVVVVVVVVAVAVAVGVVVVVFIIIIINDKHFFLPVILSNSQNYITIIHSLGEVRKVSNTYIQNNPLQLK